MILTQDEPENGVTPHLEQAGHSCCIANNGQEAIEMQDKAPADLVFMDIETPIKNGLEATKAIRQKEYTSSRLSVPIIGLSGNVRLEHQHEALENGMTAYLTKPYDKKKLLETIAKREEKLKAATPFWSKKKLVFATAIVGAVATGVTLAVKGSRKNAL